MTDFDAFATPLFVGLCMGDLHDDLSPRSRGTWDWQREDKPSAEEAAAERKRQYERGLYARKKGTVRGYDRTAALLKPARNPCPPLQDSAADKVQRARLTGKQAPMGIDL